jgi:hypothetical protein
VIVAGSRNYYDAAAFDRELRRWLEQLVQEGQRVIFISGAAKTGADRLIINWCRRNGYVWVEQPADWEKYKRPGKKNPAGHIRNREMGVLALTAPERHLIAFWDGVSPGTKGMLDIAAELDIPAHVTVVETEDL